MRIYTYIYTYYNIHIENSSDFKNKAPTPVHSLKMRLRGFAFVCTACVWAGCGRDVWVAWCPPKI